ncbi:hypothetical protein CAEBREN_15182 [Caenorhabditis brenneri]|uniref:Uncharacterized protein n=1 Tax=Caenorhabditis brenneri TaxID=135651 RepID=G0NXL7_CAEBE|nr:hypothetical protein CAEBREN_15182 [Caenorhabditis brenneri]
MTRTICGRSLPFLVEKVCTTPCTDVISDIANEGCNTRVSVKRSATLDSPEADVALNEVERVLAIFPATEARSIHCGKSLTRFIYKVCKAPCQNEEDFDMATYARIHPVTEEFIREQCCPNIF